MDKSKINYSVFILVLALICTAAAIPYSVPQSEFDCPENWGHYEDPENCIKYYNCEFGEAESATCRSGKTYLKEIVYHRSQFIMNFVYKFSLNIHVLF